VQEGLVVTEREQLSADAFFDLGLYAHRALFERGPFVWDALAEIDAYLGAFPLGEILSPIPHGVHIVDAQRIAIGRGVQIEPGCFIQGPCILGDGCTVRHGAYLRGGVIAGRGCTIGHASEVKQAILLDEVELPHFNYVGDSVLGHGVHLGAGVKCANYRLDGRPICVRWGEVKIETNRRKMGLIAGDGVQLGCNAVTSPGTLMGKGAAAHPCLHVAGWVAPGVLLKGVRLGGEEARWTATV
jgi:UDP-N-acetylglucosamine diphosphorylase / glucose-1-phosphate thymidylyltransferase / UDP-N-acetylgalactosamine diphosphorylase / glucosamine-1-phosphate N-acetyltransferase / galactosamine-1-phosphate N-acetyltransferase